ncbi:MAG: hypothetical protein Q9205_007698 [Flavoplaca limonia]
MYEHLAETKRFLGKHAEAESLYLAAHRGYEADCPYDEDSTLDMLRTAGGLANLFRTHGRYEEAEKSYREAWQGYKKYLGTDHPQTTTMLTNLAISCRNQGKFEDAEVYLEESWRIFQKSLGPDHPDSLRALMNLSICIDKQGHYKEAEIKYREVLKGREKKLGLNHPYTRRTIERLAHMLWMQGHHDQAEDLVRKVLNRIGKTYQEHYSGPHSRNTYPALIYLYTEARKRDQSKLAPDHVDALETCECLRLIYFKQGDYEKGKNVTEEIQKASSPMKNEGEAVKLEEGHKPSSPALDEQKVAGCLPKATNGPNIVTMSKFMGGPRFYSTYPGARLVFVLSLSRIMRHLTAPFFDDGFWNISHENMDMLQTAHALQRPPVFKPQHLAISIRSFNPEPLDKSPVHKRIDRSFRLGRHQAFLGIRRDPRLAPHNQMCDFRPERSIRPIIAQDPKIARIRKRCGIAVIEYRAGCRFYVRGERRRRPVEPFCTHVGCYGPVGCDDVFAPGFVDDAFGGFTADEV